MCVGIFSRTYVADLRPDFVFAFFGKRGVTLTTRGFKVNMIGLTYDSFQVVIPFHGQELVSDFGEESNGIRSLRIF